MRQATEARDGATKKIKRHIHVRKAATHMAETVWTVWRRTIAGERHVDSKYVAAGSSS